MTSALHVLNEFMAPLMPHLMLAPILLPLLTAALLLLMGEDRPRFKLIVNLLSTFLGLGIALALLGWADQQGAASTMDVYLTGNWPAPIKPFRTAPRFRNNGGATWKPSWRM